VPCHALPCPAVPYRALPCPTMPCHAQPCPTVPYRALPCPTGLGRARQGLAGLGRAWQGLAGLGRAWQGSAGLGRAWQGSARSGEAHHYIRLFGNSMKHSNISQPVSLLVVIVFVSVACFRGYVPTDQIPGAPSNETHSMRARTPQTMERKIEHISTWFLDTASAC